MKKKLFKELQESVEEAVKYSQGKPSKCRVTQWVLQPPEKDECYKYVKVFLNKNGDAKIIYPTAAKWAQEAAMLIHGHIKLIGHVTDKGVKSLVKGLWAKIIEEAANQQEK